MSIDAQYQPLYQQARDLQFKYHDFVSQPNHPSAQVLGQEMQHLVADIEMNKHPRDIEDRIKVIQKQMLTARYEGSNILNEQHTEYLDHSYEKMRRNVKEFGNYS